MQRQVGEYNDGIVGCSCDGMAAVTRDGKHGCTSVLQTSHCQLLIQCSSETNRFAVAAKVRPADMCWHAYAHAAG